MEKRSNQEIFERNFYVQFKPEISQSFPYYNPQKIAILPTCEYEGIFKNGGVGTYYKNLAKRLTSQGWYVFLLLFNNDNSCKQFSKCAELRHIFSIQEIELFLSVQKSHLVWLDNVKKDCWWNYISLSCLLFIQAIVKYFENSKIYIEFPELTGVGYQTIQAKETGLLGSNCVIATTLHSGHEWIYEANEKYAYEDIDSVLKVSYLEQYSFENADISFFPSNYLQTRVQSYGWQSDNGIHLPNYIPLF